MSNIRILSSHLINQIAAGEVVERPAGVVKELVENAIDSGADNIIIDVMDGGRTFISVIDNGCGMGRDDLENCIKRHATSKLPTDDLLNINFMGFRGEALPSIASVSNMTIYTFHKSSEYGLELNCNTGEIRPTPWDNGTRVLVKNLFMNVPARLKFLRSDRSEMMAIVETVKRLAMSRPDIGFVLNNKWRFERNEPLMERIKNVMGDDCADNMLMISGDSGNDLKLRGYASKPTLRRPTSTDQYLFVNGRYVSDRVLTGALRAAYMDVMHSREFPLCALYLTLNPSDVDVNVSPAKTEVRFLEPNRVRGFIIKTLRSAIAQTLAKPVSRLEIGDWKFESPVSNLQSPVSNLDLFEQPTINHQQPLGRAVAQIANKYILSENENGLIITDQHAAHERIVYEKLRSKKMETTPLLSPILVDLRPEEVMSIMELEDELKDCGLEIALFGPETIAINEKPTDWDLNWNELFKIIAREKQSASVLENLHLKLANYACHHSIRAGQKLDFHQMNAILRGVENTERGGQCNHGRPVYKEFSIGDLDKIFER